MFSAKEIREFLGTLSKWTTPEFKQVSGLKLSSWHWGLVFTGMYTDLCLYCCCNWFILDFWCRCPFGICRPVSTKCYRKAFWPAGNTRNGVQTRIKFKVSMLVFIAVRSLYNSVEDLHISLCKQLGEPRRLRFWPKTKVREHFKRSLKLLKVWRAEIYENNPVARSD